MPNFTTFLHRNKSCGTGGTTNKLDQQKRIHTMKRLALTTAFLLSVASAALAQGTLTTPTTPTVPQGPPVGQSTIISPGVSSPLLPSSGLAGSGTPCSGNSTSFGSITGNAGVGTAAGGGVGSTSVNGVQNGLPAGTNQPTAGSIRGINPSVTPGVPGSC
jgi:hypothetical protein